MFSTILFFFLVVIVFGSLLVFSLSPNLRRWANWNSFAFVGANVIAGFALAIVTDNLRPGELTNQFGDIITLFAVLLGIAPTIWSYFISKNWVKIEAMKAPKKPKATKLISIIWGIMAAIFSASAILSLLHTQGGGPSWWPLF